MEIDFSAGTAKLNDIGGGPEAVPGPIESKVDRKSSVRDVSTRPAPGTVNAHSQSQGVSQTSPIAGSVLPLQRAEELIASLQDVVSVRITATESGSVDAIHVLVTGDTPAKQVVRNIESALMAQLGLRVDHRKISVAATSKRATPMATASVAPVEEAGPAKAARPVYFEDVEVRGSRARGVTCRVTLRIAGEHFAGEAEEGLQSDRSRVDVAARAAIIALGLAQPLNGLFSLEGVRVINAFDREFVFAAVMARQGREQVMLTGSCEVRESAETAAVLAVLDATNRWMGPAVATGVAVSATPALEDRRGLGR